MKINYTGNQPIYKHESDAGADLRAAETLTLEPFKFAKVRTGTSVEIPSGYYGHIQSRSGLASKNGIFVLTGTIDSGFRGEILVILANFSEEPLTIEAGDRIAQMVIMKHERAEFVEVESLNDSDRGTDGYGSTGVK